MGKQLYTSSFYQTQRNPSSRSASIVVPLVLEMIQPQSIIDMGCGMGTWLSVFHEMGVPQIQGVDGDYADRSLLMIPQENFMPHDLKSPLTLDRQFDMAMSLEVAEHLPQDKAEPFVQALTKLAPVVLFSAAIPTQGGTGHINEQWQSWWAKLFMKQGYVPVDCIRHKVWENKHVCWWYAQNILMYVREDALDNYPALKQEAERTQLSMLSLVHPRKIPVPAKAQRAGSKKLLARALKIFKNPSK